MVNSIIEFIIAYWWLLAILFAGAYIYRWWKNRKGGGF